jgi:hypothetical protein
MTDEEIRTIESEIEKYIIDNIKANGVIVHEMEPMKYRFVTGRETPPTEE